MFERFLEEFWMKAAKRDERMTVSQDVAPGNEAVGAPNRTVSNVVPRAVIRPDLLSYHLLRPRDVGVAEVPLVGEAYRCWSEVWRETFRELENRSDLPSDDFTRQDEVGAIFHGYECVALSFFRWVDLRSPMIKDDSYFSVWPQRARDSACADGTNVCISSNFTLAAAWRRASGCSLKDVLAALVVERFLVSDAAALVGTMRNDRRMNDLAASVGLRPVAKGVLHHGVEVDLMVYHRTSCSRPPASPLQESIIQALRPARAAAKEHA
jgi:hypothetical protein